MHRLVLGLAVAAAACGGGARSPCSGYQFDRLKRYSLPYVGHWVVARSDTLTFPDAPSMSDRFRLGDLVLDTATVAFNGECVFRGRMTFRAPKPDTLDVSWFGQPEQAIVSGWPVDLGPFAGVALVWAGRDSLSGSILMDAKLGVQARPGMTARFVAGRLSSAP